MQDIEQLEYNRLHGIYVKAGADTGRLEALDNLLKNAAFLFAMTERLKDIPSFIIQKHGKQKEMPASKMRLKYIEQYNNIILKLDKVLLQGESELDEDLAAFT